VAGRGPSRRRPTAARRRRRNPWPGRPAPGWAGRTPGCPAGSRVGGRSVLPGAAGWPRFRWPRCHRPPR